MGVTDSMVRQERFDTLEEIKNCVEALDKLAVETGVMRAMPRIDEASVRDFEAWLRGYRKALDTLRIFLVDEIGKVY